MSEKNTTNCFLFFTTVGCKEQNGLEVLKYMRLAVGILGLVSSLLFFSYGLYKKQTNKRKKVNTVILFTFGSSMAMLSYGTYLVSSSFNPVVPAFFRAFCMVLLSVCATPAATIFLELCQALKIVDKLPIMFRSVKRLQTLFVFIWTPPSLYLFIAYLIVPLQDYYIHATVGLCSYIISYTLTACIIKYLHTACIKGLDFAYDGNERKEQGRVISRDILIKRLDIFTYGCIFILIVNCLIHVALGICILLVPQEDQVLLFQVVVMVYGLSLPFFFGYLIASLFAKIRRNILGTKTNSRSSTSKSLQPVTTDPEMTNSENELTAA